MSQHPTFYISLMEKLTPATLCPITKKMYALPYVTSCGHTVEKSVLINNINNNNICPVCKQQFDPKTIKFNQNVRNAIDSIVRIKGNLLGVVNGFCDDKSIDSIIRDLQSIITDPSTQKEYTSQQFINGCNHIVTDPQTLLISAFSNPDKMFKCSKCDNMYNLNSTYSDSRMIEVFEVVRNVITLLSSAR